MNGPKPMPYFGDTLHKLLYPAVHLYYQKMFKKYGKVYGSFYNQMPALNIADCEIIRRICTKDFFLFTDRLNFGLNHDLLDNSLPASKGDIWKKLRVRVASALTKTKIKQMVPEIEYCAQNISKLFAEAANSGEDVDVHRFSSIFGLEVISLTTFGWDLSLEKDVRDEIIEIVDDGMCPPTWKLIPYFISPALFGFVAKYFGAFKPNFYHDLCARIVSDRLKRNKSGAKMRNDFLQLLLDDENVEAKSKDAGDIYNIDSDFKVENKIRKQKLSDIEVKSQLYVNILIGYSTLGNYFTTILYLLAKYSDEQEKLYSEINEEMERSEGKIDFESISKLPYLDAFICETLRLYPSTTHSTRVSNTDYPLKEVPGFYIPKNTWVLLHIYDVHRNAEYFPEPDEFKPERFLPENRHKLVPYSYIPFGAGPRNCVAVSFNILIAKMFLIIILQKFRIRQPSKKPFDLIIKNFDNIMRVKELYCKIESRQ